MIRARRAIAHTTRSWLLSREKDNDTLPYVAVPDEAMRRRRELSHGAFDLYERYCKHRNRDTGRCDPSLTTLAKEMERTYTHVSNMKSELVEKEWVRRTGRHSVELLVGQFPPPKVQPLVRKNPNEEGRFVRKNPNEEEASLGKILTSVRKVPNEESDAPFITEPLKEPVEGAAAATASSDAWRTETADDSYVALVKSEGIYPHAFIDYVWSKLLARCRREKVSPTKGRFDYWLSIEKGTPVQQQSLPAIGAEVAAASFTGQVKPRSKAVRQPDPACHLCGGTGEHNEEECPCTFCPYCSGSGMEVEPGKGARRCRCLKTAQAPPEIAETEGEAVEPELRQDATG